MISTDLLTRLQKADNVTWERVCQTAVGEYESFDEDGFEVKYTVSYEELFDDAKEAWLQHCLQEAIRARGWWYQIATGYRGVIQAQVYCSENGLHKGNTEAEALGWAYLAAIEAIRP